MKRGAYLRKKFSERIFLACFDIVMQIWEFIDITEKSVISNVKNNMDLPVLWGEFLRGGLFTVKIISVNLPPHSTVNMPP